VAALPGGRLVVHFTNRKNAPFLFSTRIGTPPLCIWFFFLVDVKYLELSLRRAWGDEESP
jgi:hypothetical protein